MRRILFKAFIALTLIWLVACGALYRTMRQPPEKFAHVMARVPTPVAFLVPPFETLWTRARAGELEKGNAAPDFSLAKLDQTGQVHLSALTAAHRPVALIFGSYT